jgi:hypothetical protein
MLPEYTLILQHVIGLVVISVFVKLNLLLYHRCAGYDVVACLLQLDTIWQFQDGLLLRLRFVH